MRQLLSGAARLGIAALGVLAAAGCTQLLDGDTEYTLSEAAAGGGGSEGSAGGGGAEGMMECAGADLEADAKNCGACGHDCLGGKCAAGHCQPVALAKDVQWIADMAIDATHIYWLSLGPGLVERMKKDGSGRETIAQDQAQGWAIAVDDTTVYWTVPDAGEIRRADKKAGAAAGKLAGNLSEPRWLARGGPSLLATLAGDKPSIMRWPAAGGPSMKLTDKVEEPSLIVADAARAYFVDHHSSGSDGEDDGPDGEGLFQVPVDKPEDPTLIAGDLGGARALASDGAQVYWGTSSGELARVTADGESEKIVEGSGDVAGIAVDDRHVYWTAVVSKLSGKSSVWRAKKDGSEATEMTSQALWIARIFADDKALYWFERGSLSGPVAGQGSIHRLAK